MQAVIPVDVNAESLMPCLIYDLPIKYSEDITLHPIRMRNILSFQRCQCALTLRKDAIFQNKRILKMSYWDFIKYAAMNMELAEEYNQPLLPFYFSFLLQIFQMACGDDADIRIGQNTNDVSINGVIITPDIFEDIRKIILIQNDIDFDPDEFMNIDTVKAFEKAKAFEEKKNKEKANIEDYIDSLIVALCTTSEYVQNLTIRKFWRYIKRINKHESYETYQTANCSGFVTFKEPIQHWMTSFEVEDKYKDYKTDEDELRSKIGG